MANNSGFILVDASEATSMADTARNALRPRSGDGGTSPQHIDAMVKSLKQQAKEQQQAAAKELAESRTLGKNMKEVLKFVKILKDDLVDKLDEQKKLAEDTLKQAASKVAESKGPGRAPAARPGGEDRGGAYDVDSFRKATKDIDGMRGPTGAANDLIEDMRVGFERVRKSAMALGDELYGHSILPEIQRHLQAIIDQLNTIRGDSDLLSTLAATAGGSGSGSGGNKDINDAFLAQLSSIMRQDREEFFEKQREQFNQLQGGIISNINVGGGAGNKGGGGGRGLEAIAEADAQDALFEKFRKDKMLKLQANIKTIGGLAVPAAVLNIQQLNKEVNNLQGGMAGNVELAREFRIETTNALQEIRAEGGFTIQEIGSATQAVMALGVSGPEMTAKQSKIMLMGARALGAEVGDVAQTYGLQARNLKLSSEQIPEMIAGTLRIAKETGLTSKNVLELRKETQGFVDELRRAGDLSAQLTNELTRTQAVANKLGLGTFQQDLQKVFTDISQLGNVPDDLAIITAYVRNDLVKMGYSVNEILTGTMLTTVQGQRDFAKATKHSLELLLSQAEAMGSEAAAANYLQNMTKGRIKSLSELHRMIQLQTQASESQAEKAERLKKAEEQIMEMRAAGLSDALVGNAIAELTGDTSLKTIDDLRSAISTAQGSIAADQENMAADFMNKLIKRQAQLMSTSGMSASEARDKAYQEMSGTVKGELSGMSMKEISELAAKASQRASEEVTQSAEAATDNMTDRVTQGVQKGVQMITGPVSDLVDMFDKMGVGPFIGAVAMFGTAAAMLSASISALSVGIGKARGLFAAKESAIPSMKNLMNRGGQAAASGQSTAAAQAAAAGEAAIGTTSQTAQTARTVSNFVAQIGNAGLELAKQTPKLLAGLAALTIIGLAIGGSIQAMRKVYPDPKEILQLSASIAASSVAFGILAGILYGLNLIINKLNLSLKTVGQLAVALATLAVAGAAMGLTLKLLMWAFPGPVEILKLSLAIGASAIAFTVLAVALAALIGVGLILTSLTGPQALIALAAFALSLGALAVTGMALGGAMVLLINYFPQAEAIIPVAAALAASALAFGILAGSFMGIMAVGAIIAGMLLIPGGPIAVVGAIALGIAALAGTAIAMSKGMEMLHAHFKNSEKIKATGEAVTAAANAFGTLATSFLKLMAMGVLMGALPSIGMALPIVALWVLIGFAKQLDKALGSLENNFTSAEKIKDVAQKIKQSTEAIGVLAESYKNAKDAVDLSFWTPLKDAAENYLALKSLLKFGKDLGPYMTELSAAYGDADQVEKTAEKIKNSAAAIKSLAEAGVEIKKYQDESNGVFFDVTPEDLSKTLGDLTLISASMGEHIPKIIANAPDATDADRLKNASEAITSIASMMTAMNSIQEDFGDGMFKSNPLETLSAFMLELGTHMSDPRGGFHALKAGVEGMPNFTEGEVKKLDMMNQATVAVFETLKTLGEINDEFPNAGEWGRDLGDIQKTLDEAVGVFDENIRPLKNLKKILGMMPSDIGQRAEGFAKMMETLKTALLNIESLSKEFPQGGERSMEVMNNHLRYIANNLDQEAIGSLADAFGNVGLDLPNRIDALSAGIGRLPNLFTQISRIDRSALSRASEDIRFMANALAHLGDLAGSLTFEAPSVEYFERQIANLILTLGAAANSIPEVLELRSEIEAKINSHVSGNATTKTINDALTGPPGSGNTVATVSNIAELNDAMASANDGSTVSMGGAENRLDTLIKEQQQTNRLMQQLIAALVAPRTRQQQAGTSATRTFPRAGATKQNVDSAWQSEETLTTP